MSINDSKYIETRNNILKGVTLAVQNLIKERKKTNGELVLMIDGKIKHVSAKEL